MIDPSALQMMLMVLTGWLERRDREANAYLVGENRSFGISWAGVDCVLSTKIGVTWRPGHIAQAVQP